MSESDIPDVVFTLLDVLPEFEGPGLESQLQTFDVFLEALSPLARDSFVTLLRAAAGKTHHEESRLRIEAAAQSIAEGGRAAAPYRHQEAMREYRAAHAANFTGPGRPVDEPEYSATIRNAQAAKDPTLVCRGIGLAERWLAPDGRVVAWLIVRYFQGEEDYDYYVSP